MDSPISRTQAGGPITAQSDHDLGFLLPSDDPDALGRLGPYRVLDVLGSGGMGLVLLADDPALRRPVALKVMLPRATPDPVARERFLREARSAAALEHDNIVPVYGVGEDGGVPYIAMPMLKGMSLEDYLHRKGEVTVGQLLRIAREAARGLAAAHAAGVTHRDIKPANLWLDASARGRVKILDFGLAMQAGGDRITQDGAVVGTPAYMAPEQAAGKPVGPAADVFSLGAVLYRLACGRRPFSGGSPYAAYAALVTETPVPVWEVNRAVPPAFADVIMRMLDKDPLGRPTAAGVAAAATAAERERARQKASEGRPPATEASDAQFRLSTSGVRVLVVPEVVPPRRRWRLVWAAAVTVVLAAVAVARQVL